MAFVPGYDNDLFVSYAHLDDEPVPGSEKGWVTTFVTTLQSLVAQRLGCKDSFRLWVDHKLSRHVNITPEISQALQRTATLLIILSPGYIASDWCRREKDTFLSFVKNRRDSGFRVFVVQRDRVEREKWPSEFENLIGHTFWEQDPLENKPRTLGWPMANPSDPKDRGYFAKLLDLSHDIANELQRLAGICQQAEQCCDTRSVVFLAEVTDDLEDEREEVRRHLDQAGIRVLPDGIVYPRDATTFQKEVDADLARSACFVQLLSPVTGKRPPGSIHSYVRLQYERAKAAGKPIIQWRHRNLKLDLTKDPDHRAFLDSETIMAVGLEDFKSEVVKRISSQNREKCCRPSNACVFVDAEPSDRALAESLCTILEECGIDVALPPQTGAPAHVRELFKQHVLNCDAAIFVYGSVPDVWVTSQLYEWRKLASERECAPKFLAVYEGPPPECKEPLSLKLRGLRTINCRNGFNREAVQAVLRELGPELRR